MADTAALVVALSAQLTKFEKDMKDAVKIADTQTKAIETRFSQMNSKIEQEFSGFVSRFAASAGPIGGIFSALGPVGLTVAAGIGAATLAIGFLNDKTDKFVEKQKAMKEAAETTGFTLNQLKALGQSATATGVDFEKAERGIERMTVAIDELKSKGTGPLYDALAKINPALIRQVTNANSTAEAIDIVIKAYDGLADQFQKNAFASDLFGKRQIEVGRILQDLAGKGGIKAAGDSLEALGKGVDKGLNDRIVQLKKDIDEIKKKSDNLFGQAFAETQLQAQKETAQVIAFIAQKLNDIAQAARTIDLSKLSGGKTGNENLSNLQVPGLAVSPQRGRGSGASGVDESGLTQFEVRTAIPQARPSADIKRTLEAAEALQQEKDAVAANLTFQERWVGVLGDAATQQDLLRQKTLQLDKAVQDDVRLGAARVRALQAFNVAQLEQNTAVRVSLGVASEQEILNARLARIQLDVNKGIIDNTEAERARAKAVKESKDAYEAMIVSASKLPELTRFGLDAANGFKQFDTIVTSSFTSFENNFADFATGTRTFQDAFKSMTDSIIRDLVRLTLRMSVTGPLAGALSGLFGSGGGGFNFLFGGGSPSGFGGGKAAGGPVSANTPYVVGEHGPELFIPKGAGTIVPNQVTRSGSAAGLQVLVNNYASNDTETTQEQRSGPNGEQLIIGVVKKHFSKGSFDDVQRGRYGLRAVKSR